jgi:hypothetical protein
MRTFVKVEFTLLVVALLVFVIFLAKPNITGYVSSKVYTQVLNLNVDSSQEYFLEQTNVTISSLMMSGEVNGIGKVKVYIDDDSGNKLLIYSNAMKAKPNSITALTTAPGMLTLLEGSKIASEMQKEEGANIETGKFADACIDTCTLPAIFAVQKKYKLTFLVEPGTSLKITSISYTLA